MHWENRRYLFSTSNQLKLILTVTNEQHPDFLELRNLLHLLWNYRLLLSKRLNMCCRFGIFLSRFEKYILVKGICIMNSNHLKIIPSDTFKYLNKTNEYLKQGISKEKLEKLGSYIKLKLWLLLSKTNSSNFFDHICFTHVVPL